MLGANSVVLSSRLAAGGCQTDGPLSAGAVVEVLRRVQVAAWNSELCDYGVHVALCRIMWIMCALNECELG